MEYLDAYKKKLADFLTEKFGFTDSINKLVSKTVTFKIDGKITHSRILTVSEIELESAPEPGKFVKIASGNGITKNFGLMLEIANQVSTTKNVARNRVLYILAVENYRECLTFSENDTPEIEPSTKLSGKKAITILAITPI